MNNANDFRTGKAKKERLRMLFKEEHLSEKHNATIFHTGLKQKSTIWVIMRSFFAEKKIVRF